MGRLCVFIYKVKGSREYFLVEVLVYTFSSSKGLTRFLGCSNHHLVQRASERAFVSETHSGPIKVHLYNYRGGTKIILFWKKFKSQTIMLNRIGVFLCRAPGGRNESSFQNACLFFLLSGTSTPVYCWQLLY